MTDNVTAPLTVGRLHKILAGLPEEFVVWVDGCDCIEEAHGVIMEDDGTIRICREYQPAGCGLPRALPEDVLT